MKNKIFIITILIILILSSILIPHIYADSNEIVSIPNLKVKVGEQVKVYLNLENVKEYTLSKIVLNTDVYIEPVLDTANTNLTKDDMVFNSTKKEFTVTNISNDIKTLCVSYTIPQYIASGTKIKLTAVIFGYKDVENQIEEEQYKKTYEIIVDGEEQNSSDKAQDKNQSGNNTIGNEVSQGNEATDTSNIRK